ncbi:MAG: hypothetical protein ACFFA3_04005 [Promethearchaeota archaeon]
MPYDDIFEEVLKKITPTPTEIDIISKITDQLRALLATKAKELGIEYTKIEPQGSTGIKQTQLRGDYDIDLFIGLDYNSFAPKYEGLSKNKLKRESKDDFLDLCNRWIIPSLNLKEFQNPRLLYAEHPYVTVDFYQENVKIKIDIVLYFDLDLAVIKKTGPITAVDRSPWHGRFIRDNLSEVQKNDVRLLKQFFKANYSYGDKSSVGKVGFIGYSAELLIYYFENIINLFENFDKLASNPLDYYERSKKDLKKITHFQKDCLLIIDPIDKNRNVASAISERSYRYCKYRIKLFLEKSSVDFFELKPIPEMDFNVEKENLLKKLFLIELKNLDNEIHYTINRDKLYSLGDQIIANGEKEFTHIERFGKILFEVYFEDDINEYNLVIYCENPNISETYIRKGPPIKEKDHVEKFKRKNPRFFEKEGYLWTETHRDFTNFLDFLKKFIKPKIPDNFDILNLDNCMNARLSSGKKALTLLTKIILPFYI